MKNNLLFAPLGEYVSGIIAKERGLVRHLRTEVGMGARVISLMKKGRFAIRCICVSSRTVVFQPSVKKIG